MPSIPKKVTYNANRVELMNAIRSEQNYDYQSRVPVATQESIQEAIEGVLSSQATMNSFLNSLVNRIAMVIITSKSYENPLRMFKRGVLEYGEAIEEIFVNIAKAHNFDPLFAESTVFKREIPDVRTAFHRVNSKLFYKTTISNEELRLAFLSEYGLNDLIAKIVDSLYSGSEFDEYLTMKNLVVQGIKNGNFYPVKITAPTDSETARQFVTTLKSYSNKLEFMSGNYNTVGVPTFSKKRDQVLLIDTDVSALIDVEVLALAFNMSKTEFLGRMVVVDNFADLTGVYAALVDKDWFSIWDSFIGFTENYNGEGLYWNYWYHVWKIYSTSPFSNAIVFTSQTPGITSVTVTPETISSRPNQQIQFDAAVVTTGYAPDTVLWSTTAGTITSGGVLTVPAGFTTGQTITVTATSTFDETKTDTATVTYQA